MYLQHFGLKHPPLGKESTELWDDGALALLKQRFQWLLDSPGVGLLTGEAGVGKTAALRVLTANLNPHRYQLIYLAETDFARLDLYRNLAIALGLEPAFRRAALWRAIKARIQELADGRNVLPVWIIDEAQNLPPEFFRDFPAFLNFREPDLASWRRSGGGLKNLLVSRASGRYQPAYAVMVFMTHGF